ncbi:MAG: sulfite exporter TauE/SafE family protein, partial [Ginsengibacter sp.]
MKELATYSASVVIGLCLGLIGAGGSILTIPVLVYIVKTDPVASTIYSMFIMGTCSLVGNILSFLK